MPHDLGVGIIDPFHPRILETISSALPKGWSLSVAENGNEASKEEVVKVSDILFVMSAPLTAGLLGKATRLRFIQKLGAGIDRIDLDCCRSMGITVARLQAGNAVPVAEHTLLMMLAACRRLPFLDRQTRAGAWDKEAARGVSRQIGGSTVGLVGFGAIGREVARRLMPFGARVLYFDPRRADLSAERELGVTYAPLDELTARADIVSLHLPLIPETTKLFDATRIAAMKRGAILVNCARGGLVDEAALHAALIGGHIYAAAIDAFELEPPIGSPLLGLDQTVVTPHTAGGTLDNFAPIVRRAVENASRFLAGESLPDQDLVLAPDAAVLA